MLRFFLVISTLFLLASCGGNDNYYDDDPYYYNDPYYDNYYNDGYTSYYNLSYFHIKDLENYQYRVGNIHYDCGMLEGVTDSNGGFEYEDGANCIFYFNYNNTRYDLGYIDSDEIGKIYVYDLEDVTDEGLFLAITDAMDTESLEITRY
ncbi:MAG: hypothetical protein U9N49_11355 [Campylobacterota bacterium]|nr:hypothetical protein [Campylobacterota bacterium]